MRTNNSGQILTGASEPPGAHKDPLSAAARWMLRSRTRRQLLRRIDGPPDERQRALIDQILEITWDLRVARVLGDRAVAAGDAEAAMQYARLRDRHRALWLRLERAFAAACRRPPPPKPRTLAEAIAARKRQAL